MRHYDDVIMNTLASQITSLAIVYSIVYSDADQRKHQSSASLAFVRGIHRGPVNSPHKGPVTRKMFPFDDVIMIDCMPINNIVFSGWIVIGLSNTDVMFLIMTSSNGNIIRVTRLCEGNLPVTGGFPSQMPETRNFVVFYLRLNKRLRKQSRRG